MRQVDKIAHFDGTAPMLAAGQVKRDWGLGDLEPTRLALGYIAVRHADAGW